MPVTIKETGDIEKTLQQMPVEIREKQLRRALSKAVQVQAKDYRRRVPRDLAEFADDVRISRNVRTRSRSSSTATWATTYIAGLAASYSLALEYGHDVYVGETKTAARAAPDGSFREAIDLTFNEQQRVLVGSLKNDLQDFKRG